MEENEELGHIGVDLVEELVRLRGEEQVEVVIVVVGESIMVRMEEITEMEEGEVRIMQEQIKQRSRVRIIDMVQLQLLSCKID